MRKETKTRQKEKANKGITLIALVITIIVLLILVAVSISTLTGDNGILTKASEAKKQTEIANLIENVQTKILEVQATNETGKITKVQLKEILEKYFSNASQIENMPDNKLPNYILIAKEEYGGHEIKLSEIWKGSFSQSSGGEEAEKPFIPVTENQEMFEFDASTGTILRIKEEYMGKEILSDRGAWGEETTFFTYYEYSNTETSYKTGEGGCLLKKDIDKFIIPNQINGVKIKNVNYLGALNVSELIFSEGIESINGAYNMRSNHFNNFNAFESPRNEKGEIMHFFLKNITIPSSIKNIGENAFYGCYKAENIYFKGEESINFGSKCFGKIVNGVEDDENWDYGQTMFHFKNSTVANSFTTNHYDETYGTKSTNYNW